ncbi:uncharacterized protein LOC142762641 [Rhipicephalus microplus]|uniref:uncharacterized protein LOC142762641 n=1 Tax=Rhipicephalus microplus TaxID=6941 RepID=UPI003F6AE45F
MLFGGVKPSNGHVKRVAKIWKSELWRQVRVCQDWLRVVCYGNFPEGVAESKLRSARRLAAEMTEQWWCFYLRQALSALRPRVSKKESIDSDLIVIGDVQLPDNISKVLQKGPKFSHEPAVPAFELLAYNRRMAEKAGQENQERCLLEGVESLQRSTIRPAKRTTRDNLGDIVRYFKDKGLSLTMADKEGGFVIMPSAIYQEKARQAIEKNFVKRNFYLNRMNQLAPQDVLIDTELLLASNSAHVEILD